MENQEVLSKIVSYVAHAHLWHQLRTSHSDEELNDLMVMVVTEEEEILSFYGLPHTFVYSEMLQFLGLKEDFIIADARSLGEELREAAVIFLTSPVLTDLELLSQAVENRDMIENVLPAISLKLKTEPYYEYLYETKLMERLVSPKELLAEFHKVAENDLNKPLLLLSLTQDTLSDQFRVLQPFDLLFAEDFILNYQDFKKREMVQ